ncbi:AUGMIN subunit 8-like isoform X2 [Andrographis paniculata]|uniref:AUGMIN subunit 8-like isoform X2 n=1 Tax=Andrographis paniculata TaxID=175694 RepID=UPI0021E79BF7|nr:AUGMIN subunit 8-like isoform X2 [Andrographis paniculata]
MDVWEREKKSAGKQLGVSSERLPLGPAYNKNGTTRQARARVIQSTVVGPKRSPSPNGRRSSPNSATSVEKRATSSTERKSPSRLSSPSSPSTPVEDSSVETMLVARKIVGSRLPESLWPSTMRSLSVSFQSDTISIPTSKKERPVVNLHSERALRLSSNVAHRPAEISASRKLTPERKRSPLKGKTSANQSENSKPDNSLNPRLTDQHLWPSRTTGKVSSATKSRKPSPIVSSGTVTPSLRRLSLDGMIRSSQKSAEDSFISCDDTEEWMSNACSDNSYSLRMQKPGCSSSSDRMVLARAIGRSSSLPTPGSRPASPSVSRGVSPSRIKAVSSSSRGPSPAPSRGPSPAHVRPNSPSRQPRHPTSVLSFMTDIKRGKKAANHIEDVHQLRMLYNRLLQWRYANARTDAASLSRTVKAEKMIHSVWGTIADLRDSVMKKRINLQQLRLKLNLYSVLNNQVPGLSAECLALKGMLCQYF